MVKTPDDNTITPEIEFLKAILSNQFSDSLTNNGAKELNPQELDQIFPNGNLNNWKSDYELATDRTPS
jgi:hypothetical protein